MWNLGGLGVEFPPPPRVKVCSGGCWRKFPFLLFLFLVWSDFPFFFVGVGIRKFEKCKPNYRYDIWTEVRLFDQRELKELEILMLSTVVLTPSRLKIRN